MTGSRDLLPLPIRRRTCSSPTSNERLRELITRSEVTLATVSSPEERLEVFTVTFVTFQLEPLERLAAGSSATYGISQLIDGLGTANRHKMAKLFWQYIDSLRAIISEGIDQGTFRPVDVTASAFAVIGMVEHAGLWFRRGGELSRGRRRGAVRLARGPHAARQDGGFRATTAETERS